MNESAAPVPTTPDAWHDLYRRMRLVRGTEERLSADFKAGKLPGAVHLYIGQEAVAVGVCAHLGDADAITSNHRGHGHFLAKGGSPAEMMAEIYGRSNGICRGMGGSMHVADVSRGILGANGIVGAGMAIATGAAFAAQLDGAGRVAVCFFGDGAANQGVLMETLNISTLWRLPMIFVCENNGFSEFSPTSTVTAGQIIDRARAFGMPCAAVDGNDVLAVWAAAADAVRRARAGEGPSFIEARTYRIHGHLEAEKAFLKSDYRDAAEIDAWRERDPIVRFRARMLAEGRADEARCAALDAEVAAIVEAAARAAEAGPPVEVTLPFEVMFDGQRP